MFNLVVYSTVMKSSDSLTPSGVPPRECTPEPYERYSIITWQCVSTLEDSSLVIMLNRRCCLFQQSGQKAGLLYTQLRVL